MVLVYGMLNQQGIANRPMPTLGRYMQWETDSTASTDMCYLSVQASGGRGA